jgi:hypothetical protein
MTFSIFSKRKPQPSPHEEFHEYTRDIAHLQKIRDSQFQRQVLAGNDIAARDAAAAAVARTDLMIEIAQKSILNIRSRDPS